MNAQFGLLRLACISVVLALSVVACGEGKDSEDSTDEPRDILVADLEGRKVTVAVENSYLPFSYVNAATGEAEGWDYDIVNILCDRLNCEPVFVPLPWQPTLETVGRGEIDMAANGIVITQERDLIVDYADSYSSARQYLFARADETRFDSAADLSGGDYTLAAQVDTVNSAKAAELVGEENVITFAHLGEAVAAVATGRADAFLHLLNDGQELMGQHADEIKTVGDAVQRLDYGFIFSEGSDLVAPFNEALAAIKADGTFDSVTDRYFGLSFSITPDDIAPPVYGELPAPAP